MLTLEAENQLNASRLAFSWLSEVEVGSKNRPKINQKNGVQDGIHLGIDFLATWVDFGYQDGVENRSKIDKKWHRKND